MRVNPGALRFAVVIDEKVPGAQSDSGAIAPASWAPYLCGYASINEISRSARAAQEFIAAAQEKSPVDTEIVMRLVPGKKVTAGMRVRHPATGGVFDIKYISRDATMAWAMIIGAQSGMTDGG